MPLNAVVALTKADDRTSCSGIEGGRDTDSNSVTLFHADADPLRLGVGGHSAWSLRLDLHNHSPN